jgi:hypothetical protein
MADLFGGILGALVFGILFFVAKQPLWLCGLLSGIFYLGLRLLLAPRAAQFQKPWLPQLEKHWSGTTEGALLSELQQTIARLQRDPELKNPASEYLAYVKRACLPYKPQGTAPSGAARTELLALFELVKERLEKLELARASADDQALAGELTALKQTLIELIPEPQLQQKQQIENQKR